MKIFLLAIVLLPLSVLSQTSKPRFEKDTLYTSSGYKICKGMTLHFGEGSGRKGNFRFANVTNDVSQNSLTNNSVIITDLGPFGISILNNGYIQISGIITFKDSSRGAVEIHMAFDKAMTNFPGKPAELIVPKEFQLSTGSISDEIGKLYKQYQDHILTKEEFEAQKKKLLGD